MITIGSVKKSEGGKLKSYYSRDDYYFKDAPPKLLGSGAKEFSSETLTLSQFKELTREREILAKDVTFSAPKSMSIAHAIGSNADRLKMLEAHNLAVKEALEYAERSSIFRVQKKFQGNVIKEPGSGMVAVCFNHSLNRNNDPQLHSHTLILNRGFDSSGVERGVNFRAFYQNRTQLDQIYKSSMRRSLEQAGFRTRRTQDGFELEGVSREQIEAFSTRLKQVDQNLAKMGATREKSTADQRQVAALSGRKSKADHLDIKELVATWHKTAREQNLDLTALKKEPLEMSQKDRDKALAAAYKDATETDGIFRRGQLISTMLKRAENADKPLTLHEVEAFLERKKNELVKMPGQAKSAPEQLWTTTVLLQAEAENRRALDHAQGAFQGRIDPLAAQKLDRAAAGLFTFKFQGEQREAALGILTSPDAITCVQGDPGTGKTTMLEAVVAVHGSENIVGLSKAGSAAKKLGDETGIEARTIDRMVIDWKARQDALEFEKRAQAQGRKVPARVAEALENTAYLTALENGKGMILVDEASMMGSMDANRLVHIADQAGAKLVLVGDMQQLPGVGAGRPFEEWQRAGARTYRLSEIRRQRNERERHAVEAVAQRQDARAAVEIMEQQPGVVRVVGDDVERKKQIVADYMHRLEAGEKRPMLITSLNRDRKEFNAQIREQLVERGDVAADGHECTVEMQDGALESRVFAVGDQVVFLRNDNADQIESRSRVLNGTMGRIIAAGEQMQAELEDGQVVTWSREKFRNFDHAYALSTYKSQGQSVDEHVLYHAPSDSPLLTKNEFLVGISRNKNGVTVYTDYKEKMIDRAEAWAEKKTALEEFERGEQREAGSEYLNRLDEVVAARRERDAEILKARQSAVEQHGGRWSDVPRRERDTINAQLGESREAFEQDVEELDRHRSAEPHQLELEAVVAIERWREERSEVAAMEPGVNQFRAQNALDRDLMTACEDKFCAPEKSRAANWQEQEMQFSFGTKEKEQEDVMKIGFQNREKLREDEKYASELDESYREQAEMDAANERAIEGRQYDWELENMNPLDHEKEFIREQEEESERLREEQAKREAEEQAEREAEEQAEREASAGKGDQPSAKWQPYGDQSFQDMKERQGLEDEQKQEQEQKKAEAEAEEDRRRQELRQQLEQAQAEAAERKRELEAQESQEQEKGQEDEDEKTHGLSR